MRILLIGSDNLIEWDSAKDGADGSVISGATVSAQLKAGTEAAPGADIGAPVTLADVGSGRYQGTLDKTVVASLTLGTIYTIWITFTGSGGRDRYRPEECKAGYHGETDDV